MMSMYGKTSKFYFTSDEIETQRELTSRKSFDLVALTSLISVHISGLALSLLIKMQTEREMS